VNKGLETSLAEGQALEASLFAICAATEDKKGRKAPRRSWKSARRSSAACGAI
jgi:hypothetical protein